MTQSPVLGGDKKSICVNRSGVAAADGITSALAARPGFALIQRRLIGAEPRVLAINVATESRG